MLQQEKSLNNKIVIFIVPLKNHIQFYHVEDSVASSNTKYENFKKIVP